MRGIFAKPESECELCTALTGLPLPMYHHHHHHPSFMQGIYTYIPETNDVPMAAIK
jgi:hypothetical protein